MNNMQYPAYSAPLVECRSLTKEYVAGFPILNNMNFTVGRGRIVGLLGPNGSGKTTLIKLMAGLLVPNSGEILINGSEVGIETKQIVSYLPERPYFSDGMTVNNTIDFFADFYSDFDRNKAYEMLSRLGVPAKARMRTLSKGTKEKVQLILVMSRRAQLYILDEPIGGVDPAARDYILDTIISNYAGGSTVLLSTHLIYDIERVLQDVLFIANGQIIVQATSEQIRRDQNKSVDEFFREVFRC